MSSHYSRVPRSDRKLYRARFAAASAANGDAKLHDPIEADPAFKSIFRKANRLAKVELQESGIDGLGACLAYWNYKQRILREQFGIIWFTPAQMNPTTCFD